MKRYPVVLICSLFLLPVTPSHGQKSETFYLSGTDKDHTVMWDFFCTGGRRSGKWDKIAVPSCWELQGFGTFNYGRDKNPSDEKGLYRHEFRLPSSFRNKRIFIVFEGSMTDTEVKINGKPAGEVHRGSFYRFKYDITSLLRSGRNLLEVTVSKQSSVPTVTRPERAADYWIFGGIFRPVYLEAVPDEFIERIAIDARADGTMTIDLYLNKNTSGKNARAEVRSSDGAIPGSPMTIQVSSGETHARLEGKFTKHLTWNPEYPNLYTVDVTISEGNTVRHIVSEKFGFRTVEVKENDGIYVNGTKIILRGVCRHSSWPESGRTTSRELSITDVNLMKEMNMNAVRMSHYPPDKHFLDVCDSLGMYVLDEIAGWQSAYDTESGKKLIREMVEWDVNHPSIILWDNGNEGGFNPDFRNEFEKYDPQKRKVIEPWATLNGMNTKHYIPYNYGTATFFNGRDIFFPTEFNHGLFDGGHGAGLDDFWNLMISNPLSAGGFLWVFADEGIVRGDLKDSIDCAGNQAPDGIVGPFREKEGSFYTIREIWSPVFIEKKIITPQFDGRLRVENRFLYTHFVECSFSCELVRYNRSFPLKETGRKTFEVSPPVLEPGEKGWMLLNLPDDWNGYDALFITAKDPHGRLINTWSWNITSAADFASGVVNAAGGNAAGRAEGESVILSSGDQSISISARTGLITGVKKGTESVPFTNGPQFAGLSPKFSELKHYQSGNKYVAEAIFTGRPECHLKYIMHPGGWLQIEYDYKPAGLSDYWGITFDYPEGEVKGAQLMANGPYRVWKNRMKGTQFGIYDKQYNNTITGQTWDYPEFKGYYSGFYSVRINTSAIPVTIVGASDDLFLHLLTPEKPRFAAGSVTPEFPQGNISVLNGISAIGTKFSKPEDMGPQSQKNIYILNRNTEPLKGVIYIKFGD